jgi:hypothetical protein
MRMRAPHFVKQRVALCLALVTVASCATIAPFSQVAYQQATSLKAESLALMSKAATDSYDTHKSDVDALLLNVDRAYEFAKGRPKNEISARQWALLKDPAGHLLGGFFTSWKARQPGRAFVDEQAKIISDAFDVIIGLESGKVKPNDVK